MELISQCGLRVAKVVWRPGHGGFACTVVCKATFELRPELSPLAAVQEPIVTADVYRAEGRESLAQASDLVPFKLRPEVLVVGHAYAPEGRAVSSLVARLVLGEIDKSIQVEGDRHFDLDGWITDPEPFLRMSLGWERAAGGPGSLNPAGLALNADARPNDFGDVPAPNLLPPGLFLTSRRKVVPALGFGPIAPLWPQRVAHLHRHSIGWDPDRWNERPLPTDVDFAYFNAAPLDQQRAAPFGEEQLYLENLHPLFAQLSTRLAPVTPTATVEQGGRPQPLNLRCDTLVIDTDRGVATLVWRAHVLLDHLELGGRVIVTTSDAASPPSVGWGPEDSATSEEELEAEELEEDATIPPDQPLFAVDAAEVADVAPFPRRVATAPPSQLVLSSASVPMVSSGPRLGAIQLKRAPVELPFGGSDAPVDQGTMERAATVMAFPGRGRTIDPVQSERAPAAVPFPGRSTRTEPGAAEPPESTPTLRGRARTLDASSAERLRAALPFGGREAAASTGSSEPAAADVPFPRRAATLAPSQAKLLSTVLPFAKMGARPAASDEDRTQIGVPMPAAALPFASMKSERHSESRPPRTAARDEDQTQIGLVLPIAKLPFAPGPESSGQAVGAAPPTFSLPPTQGPESFGQSLAAAPPTFSLPPTPGPSSVGQSLAAAPPTFALPPTPAAETFGQSLAAAPPSFALPPTPAAETFGQALAAAPPSYALAVPLAAASESLVLPLTEAPEIPAPTPAFFTLESATGPLDGAPDTAPEEARLRLIQRAIWAGDRPTRQVLAEHGLAELEWRALKRASARRAATRESR